MGARIQNIVKELGPERVDIIEWNDNPTAFITKALSPATVSKVDINKEEMAARVFGRRWISLKNSAAIYSSWKNTIQKKFPFYLFTVPPERLRGGNILSTTWTGNVFNPGCFIIRPATA